VREVFELMLGFRIEPAPAGSEERVEVTAMVGLAGQLCGVLSLYCSKNAGELMASKMLGIPPEQVGKDREKPICVSQAFGISLMAQENKLRKF